MERRAFRMACLATHNEADALDIVQDAMLKLAQRYAQRGEDEWAPLFQRILQTRILDWHRRNKVRNRWRWFGWGSDEEHANMLDNVADPAGRDPHAQLMNQQAMSAVDDAVEQLPSRQQQALLLRLWEGMSVAATAQAMGCSEGSVKTHYSRAVHTLRDMLEEHHE